MDHKKRRIMRLAKPKTGVTNFFFTLFEITSGQSAK